MVISKTFQHLPKCDAGKGSLAYRILKPLHSSRSMDGDECSIFVNEIPQDSDHVIVDVSWLDDMGDLKQLQSVRMEMNGLIDMP